MPNRWYLFLLGIILCVRAGAQDDTTTISPVIADQYVHAVTEKAEHLQRKLTRASDKLLSAFWNEEGKLRWKVSRKDTVLAANVFDDVEQEYESLQKTLASPDKLQQYIPSLDTLSSSLKSLQQHVQLNSIATDVPGKITGAIAKLNGLEIELRKAEEIKKFIKQRKQILQERLGTLGMSKVLSKLNKQAYYYSAQVNEYRELLKGHQKAEKKRLSC